MTYQKVKTELVEEKKVMTVKELRNFMVMLALLLVGVALLISLPVSCILGTTFALIVLIACVAIYFQMFNYLCEDTDAIGKWRKVVKVWVIPYILTVVVYFVLKYFNFL